MPPHPNTLVRLLVCALDGIQSVTGGCVVLASAVEALGKIYWYDNKGVHAEKVWNYTALPIMGRVKKIVIGRTDRTELELELQIERISNRFTEERYKTGKNDHLAFTGIIINYLTHNGIPTWITVGCDMYKEILDKFADVTMNMLLRRSVGDSTITPEQELIIRLSHVMDATLLVSSNLDTLTRFATEIDTILSKYIGDEDRPAVRAVIQELADIKSAADEGRPIPHLDEERQTLCCAGIKTMINSFDQMGRTKKRFVIFDVLRAVLTMNCKFPEELYDGSFVNSLIPLYIERQFRSQACPISLCLFLTNHIATFGYQGIDLYDMALMLVNIMRQHNKALFHYVLNVCINLAIIVPTQLLVEEVAGRSLSDILVEGVVSVLLDETTVCSPSDAEQASRFIGRSIAATFGHNNNIVEQAKQLMAPRFYSNFKATIMPTLGELFWILNKL